jgi:hypothetical protein
MRVKLQLVMCNDEGDEETVTDVITLNKNNQRIEHLGLTLSEAKQLLSTTQRHLLRQQVDAFLNTYADCPDCGTPLHLKARSSRSFRTLFGTFQFYSPRLEHCDCKRHKTSSFRRMAKIFELAFLLEVTPLPSLAFRLVFHSPLTPTQYTYCMSRRNLRGGIHLRVRWWENLADSLRSN